MNTNYLRNRGLKVCELCYVLTEDPQYKDVLNTMKELDNCKKSNTIKEFYNKNSSKIKLYQNFLLELGDKDISKKAIKSAQQVNKGKKLINSFSKTLHGIGISFKKLKQIIDKVLRGFKHTIENITKLASRSISTLGQLVDKILTKITEEINAYFIEVNKFNVLFEYSQIIVFTIIFLLLSTFITDVIILDLGITILSTATLSNVVFSFIWSLWVNKHRYFTTQVKSSRAFYTGLVISSVTFMTIGALFFNSLMIPIATIHGATVLGAIISNLIQKYKTKGLDVDEKKQKMNAIKLIGFVIIFVCVLVAGLYVTPDEGVVVKSSSEVMSVLKKLPKMILDYLVKILVRYNVL